MKIGIIGLGFMGGVHLKAWQRISDAEVVAVCDANPIFKEAKQGNIAASSGELNLDGIAVYSDIADMLAEESLDAVSITLPTHLHKTVSIQCLEAGVHVLCEKPMALKTTDCEAMITAAKSAGKELMIAHCIRFWPAYAWLKQTVEQGTYGNVHTATFERLSSMPGWSEDSWFSDPEKSGGIALDLHIHDLDFIQYLFGKPERIESRTVKLKDGNPGHVQTWIDYPENRTVTATASWMMPESFGFKMAFNITFENAAVAFDGQTLQVFGEDPEPLTVELPEGDGYQHEIEHFAKRIQGKASESIISPEQAAESVRMALETIS